MWHRNKDTDLLILFKLVNAVKEISQTGFLFKTTFCLSELIQGDSSEDMVSSHSAGGKPIKPVWQNLEKEESGDQALIWILLVTTEKIVHLTLCTVISAFNNITHFCDEGML